MAAPHCRSFCQSKGEKKGERRGKRSGAVALVAVAGDAARWPSPAARGGAARWCGDRRGALTRGRIERSTERRARGETR